MTLAIPSKLWNKLGGAMNSEDLKTVMHRVLEDRRAEVRTAVVRGRCPRCSWKPSPGVTLQLEYEIHLANHQIEAFLSNTVMTQGG